MRSAGCYCCNFVCAVLLREVISYCFLVLTLAELYRLIGMEEVDCVYLNREETIVNCLLRISFRLVKINYARFCCRMARGIACVYFKNCLRYLLIKFIICRITLLIENILGYPYTTVYGYSLTVKRLVDCLCVCSVTKYRCVDISVTLICIMSFFCSLITHYIVAVTFITAGCRSIDYKMVAAAYGDTVRVNGYNVTLPVKRVTVFVFIDII